MPLFTFAYNSTIHEATKHSPHYLIFGKELKGSIDLVFGTHHSEQWPNPSNYAQALVEKLANAHQIVRETLKRSAEVRIEKHDFHVKPQDFQIGDLVDYFYPRKRPGLNPKWMSCWDGPFHIISREGRINFRIKHTLRNFTILANIHKLKRAKGWQQPQKTPPQPLKAPVNPVRPNPLDRAL